MKRYAHFIAVMLISMFGCNLLKNTSTESAKSKQNYGEKFQMDLLEQKKLEMNKGSLFIHQDSSVQDYTVQLWPKGAFTYSASSGFSGEADHILITGRKKFAVRDSTSTQLRIQDSGRVEGQLKQQVQYKNKDTNTTKTASPPSLLILGILLMIIVAGIWLFKK